MPKRVNLKQGSEAWLAWRQSGIGASDLPIILEESPFQSAFGLWLIKTGRAKNKVSAAMQRGTDNEDKARQLYITASGIDVAPAVFEYDDAEYVRASLDGWNEEQRHILEVKWPNDEGLWRKVREGQIPRYYMMQVVQQMIVADALTADFYVHWHGTNEGLSIRINRADPLADLDGMTCDEFWFEMALPAIQEFQSRVEQHIWPPIAETGQVKIGDDPAWIAGCEERAKFKMMMKEAEDGLLRVDAALRRRAGESRYTVGGGYKARWDYLAGKQSIIINVSSEAARQDVLKFLGVAAEMKRADVLEIRPHDLAPSLRFNITAGK